MYINHEYLTKLDKPYEAITEDIWRSWRTYLINKSKTSKDYKTLLSKNIKNIANNAEILWAKRNTINTVEDIIKRDLLDINNSIHTVSIKRAIVLTISKLVELSEEDINKVINTPLTEGEMLKILIKDEYNNSRMIINKEISRISKETNSENFEFLWKQFIITVLKEISLIGEYSEEQLRKYLPIMMNRLYHMKSIKDIAEETNEMGPALIKKIIKRMCSDFSEKMMATEEQLNMFDRKLISLYEKVHIELKDPTEKWVTRLDLIKTFRKEFVKKTLDE